MNPQVETGANKLYEFIQPLFANCWCFNFLIYATICSPWQHL